MVLSCTGGIGPCTTVTINRFGVMLAEKYNTPYRAIMGQIHCHLNFALLRMRGARSSFHHPAHIDISAAALHQWKVKYEQLRERPITSDLNLLPIFPDAGDLYPRIDITMLLQKLVLVCLPIFAYSSVYYKYDT